MRPQRIIVIGASAGGLDALRRLFSGLDPALYAAILAVVHTAPDSRYLGSLLSQSSTLPLKMAADGPIHQGVIYIAPPDVHLLVERDSMCLVAGPKENRFRPSIDVLFRSAAMAYRDAVIGVVLTGMLDDGTAGLFYVKRYAGTTVVQDPNDAEFKSMPLTALTYVKIDYLLPLNKISHLLNELAGKEKKVVPTDLPLLASLQPAILQEDARAGIASLFTCPDCQGPLLEIKDGSPLRFRCRVGHAYGLASLSHAQAEHTEKLVWSALQSLQARAELEQTLIQIAEMQGDKASVEKYDKRHSDTNRSVELLKEVVKFASERENGN